VECVGAQRDLVSRDRRPARDDRRTDVAHDRGDDLTKRGTTPDPNRDREPDVGDGAYAPVCDHLRRVRGSTPTTSKVQPYNRGEWTR
jgi:hypothetical protein